MIQKPKGTRDLYNKEAEVFSKLKDVMSSVAKSFNFKEIYTPIFESKELFVKSVGDSSDVVKKEMYDFIDKGNRQMVLRPEGTASVVRAFLENKLYTMENLPFKTFYFGPMFRYERPQVGRFRQFHQFGAEVFGPNSFNQDLEVLTLALTILKQIKLDQNLEININYLVNAEKRKEYINDLIKSLNNLFLCSDCKERIQTNPLRVLDCKLDQDKFNEVPSMQEYLSEEDEEYFDNLKNGMNKLGIKYKINDKLVRGLDYYTGFIFEIKYISNDLGSQDTIVGGGRYNNLVSEMNGPSVPAAGFAIGIERLMIILENNNIEILEEQSIDLFTIAISDKAMEVNQRMVFELREQGFSVETDLMKRSFKSAFKLAEKLNAKKIIIIGDKEVETNIIEIKDEKTKTIKQTKLEEIARELEK